MAQSPSLRFYKGFGDKKPSAPTIQESGSITNQPDNVQGWLMNIHTYREPSETNTIIVDADNNSIPIERTLKKGRPESIASEDSVNLDELINANFTVDMDDETDLPDLGELDLDDSAEDFWKMDNNEPSVEYDLDWNPNENIKRALIQEKKRSDSFSSENSLNSQSTVTQYGKYGMAPMVYPSESSSSSSRSLSRLSNYSATSSNTTRTTPTGGIPTPSRSYTARNPPGSTKRITKRASHIPAPASSSPTPQRTTSSSSNKNNSSIPRIPTTTKRIPQRASHIPTVRESIHRPGSPLNSGRNSTTPSRIGMRSPTPGPRNSLFTTSDNNTQTSSSSSSSREETTKRVLSPTTNRPSGLRPPASTNVRSISRIGTVKKS